MDDEQAGHAFPGAIGNPLGGIREQLGVPAQLAGVTDLPAIIE
jgi:hypothetical protein